MILKTNSRNKFTTRMLNCTAVGTKQDDDFPCLNLLGVNYDVKEYVGPWYKGACFRYRRHKKVLRDVTVQFKGGELTALLGNSGSGKTSLLDIIACRTSGKLTGKVYYQNQEMTSTLFQSISAYVIQADRLLATLSVRETLTYAAYLRLPGRSSKQEIKDQVQRVIIDMGLRQVSDSRIGGLITRGISGGEKRRVTIAIQLLQDPNEPTSGLDSHTAHYLVSKLAEIAHRGKIVILTIHQPRSDIFDLFDQIGLMSVGEMAYFGKAGNLVSYFTNLGYPCPKYANPLDHYISVDRRNYEQQHNTLFRVHKLIDSYLDSQVCKAIRNDVIEETIKPSRKKRSINKNMIETTSVFRAFFTLYRRLCVNLWRDRHNWLARIYCPLFYVAVNVLYLQQIKDDQQSIQNRIGLIYNSITVPFFGAIIVVIPSSKIPSIRDVFYRERRDGLYSVTTFLIAYMLHVLPVQIFSSVLFSVTLYCNDSGVGMYNDIGRFGIYFGIVISIMFIGEITTMAIMGAVHNPGIANTMSSLFVSASVLVSSGLLRSLPNMLEGLQWLSYITVFRYSSQILAANEFNKLNLTCTSSDKGTPCQYPSGDAFLADFFPYAVGDLKINIGIVVNSDTRQNVK
ncbi:hypothetical protein KUTeg_012933 [Tegillarca granosa]|uniref:ABC transporter domain-containing protein n=1 Tax=Tegillarca granosa TaxID=220873 RepID=A0ABQ9ES75_TEGGR|nr:hypothetical protein KUTeg_012933 [Tegillarca granosa]